MQRIEKVRQKLSWLTGNPYRPSEILQILERRAQARLEQEQKKAKKPRKVVKFISESPRRLTRRGKRPGVRYRCRSCRLYTPRTCPRCRIYHR